MMRLIVEIQSNCIFSAFYSKLINTPSLTSDLPNIHRQSNSLCLSLVLYRMQVVIGSLRGDGRHSVGIYGVNMRTKQSNRHFIPRAAFSTHDFPIGQLVYPCCPSIMFHYSAVSLVCQVISMNYCSHVV